MRLGFLLAVVATVSPLSALTAQTAESQQSDAQKAEEAKKAEDAKKRDNQVVCKSTLNTGSRVHRTRVCMTRWEKKIEEERARRDTDAIRSRSQPEGGPTPF
jgi:Flp pilus assembly protein CpaB